MRATTRGASIATTGSGRKLGCVGWRSSLPSHHSRLMPPSKYSEMNALKLQYLKHYLQANSLLDQKPICCTEGIKVRDLLYKPPTSTAIGLPVPSPAPQWLKGPATCSDLHTTHEHIELRLPPAARKPIIINLHTCAAQPICRCYNLTAGPWSPASLCHIASRLIILQVVSSPRLMPQIECRRANRPSSTPLGQPLKQYFPDSSSASRPIRSV